MYPMHCTSVMILRASSHATLSEALQSNTVARWHAELLRKTLGAGARLQALAAAQQPRQPRDGGRDQPWSGAGRRQRAAQHRRERGGLAVAAEPARQAALHGGLERAAAQQHLRRKGSKGLYYHAIGCL